MFWIEIEDLTGWLCKTYDNNIKGGMPLYSVICKRGRGLDKWIGYDPTPNMTYAIEKATLHAVIEEGFYDFLMGYEFERKELTPIRKVIDINAISSKLSWKIMSDAYYELESILRKYNYSFHRVNDNIVIDHKGPVYLNNITQLPENTVFNNEGFVALNNITQLPENTVFNNKGNVYLNNITQLPENTVFNNKGNVYLFHLPYLPENKEQIFKNDGKVYYNKDNEYYSRIDKYTKQNKLFIYVKPEDPPPLSIEEAHTTIVYLNNEVEEKDRQKIILDISNILKNYSPPKCSWEGVATFDNDDKSRVILINFENGAELYSDIVETLSKYIDVDRDYNFIPHTTIDKDLEISELPEYSWNPKSIYIEFEENIPAIEIEFKTGKVKESQNLQETVGVEESKKLSWKEPDNYDGWLVRVEESTRKKVFWEYAVISRIVEDGLYVYFGENEEEAINDTFDPDQFPFYVKKEEFDFVPIRQVKSYKSSSNAFDIYKDKNSEMYQKRLMFYNENNGPEIFWSSKTAQEKRFEALLDIGDLTDKEILDVGCGYGDFLTYIKNKGININKYVGVDIVEDIVKKAKELHPDVNISARDIQKDPIEEDSFDYVFGSGIFAVNDPNWNFYVVDMLKKMLSSSKIGVGVNFLKEQNINRLSWKIMSDAYYDLEDTLRKENYSFHRVNDNIVIDHEGFVALDNITQLPENTVFNNKGYVALYNLTQLPENIVFNNKGYVNLYSLTQLPENTVFNNKGNVYLDNLTQLPENTVFNNKGYVYLYNLPYLPENKEQIFKNDGVVIYFHGNTVYDPRTKKLSWKEPETLVGWLVQISGWYGVVLGNSRKGYINIILSPTEEDAIEDYYGLWSNTAYTDLRHHPSFSTYSIRYVTPLYKVDSYKKSSINQLKYNNPQTILNLIKQNITDKVILKDNYLNDDFTIFLYKS